MKGIKQFLEERPSLSKAGVCKEAGISNSMLDYILNGKRNLTENVKQKLYPVLNKYGGNF